MGEHKSNMRSIQAAQPVPRLPPGSEVFGFSFETQLELNKEKMAEVVALIDAATAAGRDPRTAVPVISPNEHPEWFDYVVYNRPSIGRPSALQIDPRQIPTAQIRWSEHIRIPLVDLRARVDEAFAATEARGDSH
jgi:hypothetical protein